MSHRPDTVGQSYQSKVLISTPPSDSPKMLARLWTSSRFEHTKTATRQSPHFPDTRPRSRSQLRSAILSHLPLAGPKLAVRAICNLNYMQLYSQHLRVYQEYWHITQMGPNQLLASLVQGLILYCALSPPLSPPLGYHCLLSRPSAAISFIISIAVLLANNTACHLFAIAVVTCC